MSTAHPHLSLNILAKLFIPFALGYFLSYLYRVVNTVITTELSGDIGIHAGQLGLLTSVYFITFAATQLPLGILLDRYSPHRVEAVFLLFAAAGSMIFALSSSLEGLIIGRGLIGLGVSACLMAAFKAFVQWFPPQQLPTANGLLLAAGATGIIAASLPVEYALQFMDWRSIFWILAVITVFVALLIFFLVPDKPCPATKSSLHTHWQGIVSVFTSRYFWHIAPWSVSTQSASLAILSLWSGPWLRDVAGLERGAVAIVLFWLAMGVVAGYACIGSSTAWLSKKGISTLQVASVGMLLFMLIQVVLAFGFSHWPTLLWLAFGFFGTTGVLAYAYLSQQFPQELAGRVNTALNLILFLAAFLVQWGFGEVVHYYSDNDSYYHPQGYQTGFLILIVIQVITFLFFLYQKQRLNTASA